MQLNDRKRQVLTAIVEDYVLTATPVGSRTICGKYFASLSSATIRNEMNTLTHLGYLEQPHISAGRVPNHRAYRLYVDGIQSGGTLTRAEEQRIRQHLLERVQRLDDVVAGTAEALSELTRYAVVALMPKQQDLRIMSLHLVPVSRNTALLVVVTDGGIIRDAFVHIAEVLDQDALYAISRMLSDQLHRKTMGQAQQLLRALSHNAALDSQVLEGIAEMAQQLEKQAGSDSLRVSGAHYILGYPEYRDVDKAVQVMAALEDKGSLLELLKEDADGELTVRIGPENGIPALSDLSIVSSSYLVGRGHRGAIALAGPTRMPYGRVLGTLNVAARTISDMLASRQ